LALGADLFQGSGVPKWATSADRKRGRTGQENKKSNDSEKRNSKGILE